MPAGQDGGVDLAPVLYAQDARSDLVLNGPEDFEGLSAIGGNLSTETPLGCESERGRHHASVNSAYLRPDLHVPPLTVTKCAESFGRKAYSTMKLRKAGR